MTGKFCGCCSWFPLKKCTPFSVQLKVNLGNLRTIEIEVMLLLRGSFMEPSWLNSSKWNQFLSHRFLYFERSLVTKETLCNRPAYILTHPTALINVTGTVQEFERGSSEIKFFHYPRGTLITSVSWWHCCELLF